MSDKMIDVNSRIRKCLGVFLALVIFAGGLYATSDYMLAKTRPVYFAKKTLTLKTGQTKKISIKKKKGIKIIRKKFSKKGKAITITKKGKVTAVKRGTSYAICKIKYRKDEKNRTITLKCKVNVKKRKKSAGAKTTATPAESGADTASGTSAEPVVSAIPEKSTEPVVTGTPEISTEPVTTEIPKETETVPTKVPETSMEPGEETPGTSAEPVVTGTPGTSTEPPTESLSPTEEPESTVDEDGFKDLSPQKIISEFGTGFNIGNTLEAFSNGYGANGPEVNEYAWNTPHVTEKTFTHLYDLGFRSVRIPVTWGNMINDDYSINEARLGRVQEFVDAAIEAGLYVVINMHHDGMSDDHNYTNFLKISDITDADNMEDPIYLKFKGTWKSIAERFSQYNEKLVFESMNEVYYNDGNSATVTGWSSTLSKGEMTKINNLNQIFVDTVRGTGKNNAKRWLIVPTQNTRIDIALGDYGFEMPKDTLENSRIMLAVHDYLTIDATSFDEEAGNSLPARYAKLKEKYVDNGIPVFVGEYGPISMTSNTFDVNDESNRIFYEGYNLVAKKCGVIPMAWDTGSIVDRADNGGDVTNIIDAIMKGYKTDEKYTDIEGVDEIPENSVLMQIVGGDSGTTKSFYATENDEYEVTFISNSGFSSSSINCNWYIQTDLSENSGMSLEIKSGYAMVNGQKVELNPSKDGVHVESDGYYQITLNNPWNSKIAGFSNISDASGAKSITMVIKVSAAKN